VIALKRGGPAPVGSWYSVTLRGFPLGAWVEVTCRSTTEPDGFWTQTFQIRGDDPATDSMLCYGAGGPDHWVTAGHLASNHVTW
jgi:hypothetical protein